MINILNLMVCGISHESIKDVKKKHRVGPYRPYFPELILTDGICTSLSKDECESPCFGSGCMNIATCQKYNKLQREAKTLSLCN